MSQGSQKKICFLGGGRGQGRGGANFRRGGGRGGGFQSREWSDHCARCEVLGKELKLSVDTRHHPSQCPRKGVMVLFELNKTTFLSGNVYSTEITNTTVPFYTTCLPITCASYPFLCLFLYSIRKNLTSSLCE